MSYKLPKQVTVVFATLLIQTVSLKASERLVLYPTTNNSKIIEQIHFMLTSNGWRKSAVDRKSRIRMSENLLRSWKGSSQECRLTAVDGDLAFRIFEGAFTMDPNPALHTTVTLHFRRILWVLAGSAVGAHMIKDLVDGQEITIIANTDDRRRIMEMLADLRLEPKVWQQVDADDLFESYSPGDSQVLFLLTSPNSPIPVRLIKDHNFRLIGLDDHTVQELMDSLPFWDEVLVIDPSVEVHEPKTPIRRTVGIRVVLVSDHIHHQQNRIDDPCILTKVTDMIYEEAIRLEQKGETWNDWSQIGFRTGRTSRVLPMHSENPRWHDRREALIENRGVDLRAKRFKTSKVIGRLFIGERAEIVAENWDSVGIRTTNGREGWVARKHFLTEDRPYLAVDSSSLNLRTGPSTSFPKRDLLRQDELLEPIDPTCFGRDHWCAVRVWDGLTENVGWVATNFVRKAGDVGFVSRPLPGLKVGFVYIGDLADFGWSQAHDEGRRAMETKNAPRCGDWQGQSGSVVEPGEVKTVCREAVLPKDIGMVIRELVGEDCNVIFATSLDYQAAVLKAAYEYRDVLFFHTAGTVTAYENYNTYFGRMYEARYLAGFTAGSIAREHKIDRIGFVAAKRIPEVIRAINAFTLGAKRASPEIRVHVGWNGKWIDRAKSRRLANCMLDAGIQILAMDQDSSEVPIVVERRKRRKEKAGSLSDYFVLGYHMDMSEVAPQTHLTAPVWRWGYYYQNVAKQLQAGSWKPAKEWLGLADGLVGLAPFSTEVPDSVISKLSGVERAITHGEFQVFSGPISDANGKVVIHDEQVMTDDDLLNMTFYVDGVVFDAPECLRMLSEEI